MIHLRTSEFKTVNRVVLALLLIGPATQSMASGFDTLTPVAEAQRSLGVAATVGIQQSSSAPDPKQRAGEQDYAPLEMRVLRQELVLSRSGARANGSSADSAETWIEILELEMASRQGATWHVVSESENEIRLIVECSFETCAGLDTFNRRLLKLTGATELAEAESEGSDASRLWLNPRAQEAAEEKKFLEGIIMRGGELPKSGEPSS
jgi:hypothetical protein